MRRVETFANQVEKKLVKAKKTYEEVFVNRMKVKDGCFRFEDVKNVIVFNLQMEESIDCRMFLRYIQNLGGNNVVSVDQLKRLIISKKELSNEIFNQVLEFVANSNEIIRELDQLDY